MNLYRNTLFEYITILSHKKRFPNITLHIIYWLLPFFEQLIVYYLVIGNSFTFERFSFTTLLSYIALM